jgi:DNA repair exonuclease SbcCD ATPase subunit
MQIQIKSLEVKNCGPLRDVEIDFTTNGTPRPVTVIGGANGSGKTTILELIVGLSYLLYGKLPDDLSQHINTHILTRTQKARLYFLADGKEVSTFWETDQGEPIFGVDQSKVKEELNFSSKIRTQERLKREAPSSNNNSNNKLPTHARDQMPSVLYFPDYRRLEAVEGQQINRENVHYKWIYRYGSINSFKGSLDSYLVWLDYAHPQQFTQIKHFLNETVLVGKSIEKVDRPELATMIKLNHGQTHRLDKLSSGEQNLLIIMLELRRRLLPGSIVLIDEIENSLHPAFQHRLAEALLKLQKQVPFQLIVTTHAPSFLDAFGVESTLLLTEF